MSISNSVVCYYAEKWKCSDGNVIEFDKTWTSRISLERHWYVLFFISNVSRCTECTEMHTCLCTTETHIRNGPSWNEAFNASSVATSL